MSSEPTRKSMDQKLLVDDIVRGGRIATTYGLPIILSTVNVATGRTRQRSRGCRPSSRGWTFGRTTISGWEDVDVHAAVRATGRRKLVTTASWNGDAPVGPVAGCDQRGA
jgi:hypothetical protein